MTQLSLSPNDIDLTDPEIFETNQAHEVFRMLRREAPVHWNAENEVMRGFWNVTRYADVIAISRNPELYISSHGITQMEPVIKNPMDEAMQGFGKMLITMDPPRHVHLRRLVNKGFTPRAVSAMEIAHPRDRDRASSTTSQKKPGVDFVTDVAAQLPLAVICEMMGCPQLGLEPHVRADEQGARRRRPGVPDRRARGPARHDRGRPSDDHQRLDADVPVLGALHPGRTARTAKDDLVSLLIDSEVDGDKLTDEDILWFAFLLIVAGNETTRNAISGGHARAARASGREAEACSTTRRCSARRPSRRSCAGRRPSRTWHASQRATRSFADSRSRRASASSCGTLREPRRGHLRRPVQASTSRARPNDHLAFGIGEHFCLGAGFARLELKVIFEELFRRFPDIALSMATPERLRSTFIGGIKHLPVAYTPV